MAHDLHIVDNALPTTMVEEIVGYVAAQKYVRTNHTSWNPSVVGLSGPIYITDIEGNLKTRVQAHIASLMPDWKLDELDMVASHNACGRYGFIPWHDDGNHLFSVTVYLNELWDKDWAGHLLYEKNGPENIAAVLPSFNKAVLFRPPVNHCVVMPNINAPLRRTLQLFFGQTHGN